MNHEITNDVNDAARAMARAYRNGAEQHRRRATMLDRMAAEAEAFADDRFDPSPLLAVPAQGAIRQEDQRQVERRHAVPGEGPGPSMTPGYAEWQRRQQDQGSYREWSSRQLGENASSTMPPVRDPEIEAGIAATLGTALDRAQAARAGEAA